MTNRISDDDDDDNNIYEYSDMSYFELWIYEKS